MPPNNHPLASKLLPLYALLLIALSLHIYLNPVIKKPTLY
jgi:hypothetical protein